ncbi:putative endopeptidase [Mucilaginibacter oryzae]|uniref:Putative endopeptidase n=1 Tax=Mucilaginibacter oryzae TaxID=468058 RepID=A0A316HFE1_9SPHI|nr:M13 family metallopeptidase [Mucilaginibacter oryzae]PWK79939.1 putative endopeptidase [Mucilaginibacter oryzae]
MKLKLYFIVLAAALGMSVNVFAADGPKPVKAKRKTAAPPKKFIDPANMDLAVKPGDDFFEYANGGWLKRNAVPAKETRWGSFNILRQENIDKLIGLLNEVSKTSASQPKGSLKQRVGDLYASGMDTLTIEKRGYDPIKPFLNRIDKIRNLDDVINELVYERVNGAGSAVFGFSVDQDDKYVNRYIVNLGQGGINLPDRDYYLKSDARSKKAQEALKKLIVTLFTLTGSSADEAAKNADIVYNLEYTWAKAQLSRVAMRDPHVTYNKFLVADFEKQTPHLKWSKILPALKAGSQDSIIVAQPSFFRTTDSLLAATPVANLKIYLRWHILRGAAVSLSSDFVKAGFAFSSALSGQKVQTPRKERMSAFVDNSLGELLGQLFVEKYFTPAAKQYMVALVNNLKATLGDRIKRLEWMSPATKDRALKKLNAFTVKIGYPDNWEKYDGIVINRDDYYGNLTAINIWKYNFNVSRLGKPVDKTRWGMTPPTVNAYYNPTNNEIVFPAGILQFPFFDFNADDAINYGGIGAVIGHEMTHGFDDQGRQYDADGTLRDWWTAEDANKFKSRADQVVAQYNAFKVLDSLHVNGKLTLGENLADLGGLNIAYEAFSKTKQARSGNKADGFMPDQRFFLSWAQVWRSAQTPEAAAQRILTDPHSPEQFRTNAPVTNMDAWYKAFDVKPGDKMYKKPEERIKIW